jgi:hypothetical protein
MLPLIISIIIFAITSISIFSIIFIKNKNKSGGVAGIGNKFKKHLQMVYMVESWVYNLLFDMKMIITYFDS